MVATRPEFHWHFDLYDDEVQHGAEDAGPHVYTTREFATCSIDG